MSIIYHFSAKPLAGKRSSTISIIRTSAGILARLGALQTRVYHNMLGGSLGNIGLGCTFDSFSEAIRPPYSNIWRTIRNVPDSRTHKWHFLPYFSTIS